MSALKPLLDVGRLVDQQANLLPYAALVPPTDNIHYGGAQRPLISSGLAVQLSPELAAGLPVGIGSRLMATLQIRSVGGAVNDVAPDATVDAHRHHIFLVSSLGGRADAFHRHWTPCVRV